MAQSSNRQSFSTNRPGPIVALVAVAQWLLVLPASVLLVAAALRMLQPREFQPSRACWAIVDWAATHVSHLDAAAVFIALPAAVILLGFAVLRRTWRREQTFRQDAATAIAILRRQA